MIQYSKRAPFKRASRASRSLFPLLSHVRSTPLIMSPDNDPAAPAGNVVNDDTAQRVEAHDPAEREFSQRFEVMEPLGSGSFGEVFNGFDRTNKLYVAIKMERTASGKRGSLQKEAARYQVLTDRLAAVKRNCLPLHAASSLAKIFGFYELEKKSFLVMEKMGPSLESLYQKCERRFSLKTVCQIAIQMIDRIQVRR